MSTNPFADNSNPYSVSDNSQGWSVQPDGYSKQITLVGILTIIQACLEMLMSLVFFATMGVMAIAAKDPKFPKMDQAGNGMTPEVLQMVLAGMAGCACLIGILRLTSGIMMIYRRGRVFSIVMSIIGLATMLTVYCGLTSLALTIYSLIILVQPSVNQEYERARQKTIA